LYLNYAYIEQHHNDKNDLHQIGSHKSDDLPSVCHKLQIYEFMFPRLLFIYQSQYSSINYDCYILICFLHMSYITPYLDWLLKHIQWQTLQAWYIRLPQFQNNIFQCQPISSSLQDDAEKPCWDRHDATKLISIRFMHTSIFFHWQLLVFTFFVGTKVIANICH